MENQKISVLMGVYNEKISWLNESVESILNQTYSNFEFIIIDDNPDNKEIKNYLLKLKQRDERIIIIFNDSNIGLTKSLNKGLEVATGEFIARMDADDISINTRFERQLSYLNNHSKCDAVFGFFYCIKDEDKTPIELKKAGPSNKRIIDKLFRYNVLPHPLVMLKRSSLEKFDLKYDEHFIHAQDYDLWLMMAIKGCSFYVIPKPLLYYRISDNQITKSKSDSQLKNAINAKKKCIKQYLNDAGLENQTIISKSVLTKLYDSIERKRKWNDTDKQIFFMLYVSFNMKPLCFINVLLNSIYKYHFTIQQLLIIFISCFRTVNTYQIKSILREINVACKY